jgi:hypothetical protein
LREDRELFDLLASTTIHITDEISTHILLPLDAGPLRVPSDRTFIHHEVIGGQLNIYVPSNQQQQRACYRSQLPKLLANLMGVTPAATFSISAIATCELKDLGDVLTEQDVFEVDWIEKPVIIIPEPLVEEPITPTNRSGFDSFDAATAADAGSGLLTPRTLTPYDASQDVVHSYSRTGYARLVEHVLQSVWLDMSPIDEEYRGFNHAATFGTRQGDEFGYNSRIGAAGESYVGLPFDHLALGLTCNPDLRASVPPWTSRLYAQQLAKYHTRSTQRRRTLRKPAELDRS